MMEGVPAPSRTALAMLLAILAAAAIAHDPTLVYSGRQGQLEVRPPRLDAAVTLDGVLDDPAWQQAAMLTGFSQYAPSDGRPADDSTEVLVWYSATAIHFGIRAYERHGAVNATLAERDRIAADDNVELLLGTFNDGRQAMVFAVNPFGVQADGILVETGATSGGFSGATVVRERPDLSPDYVFESKGRLTDYGFEVEIRIPFKSLRYQPAEAQTWGLNIVRNVRHSGFEDAWAPAQRAASSFLRQSGSLTGLTDLRRGVVLDITPEVTTAVSGAPAAGGWAYDRERPEVGATVRWGVTNNLTMNGTVNPDFSQVESDAGQFTFDPRQAIFFAEKRPFFLDGIEQFSTPNSLIYSRRIVQPVVAAKIAGKVSGTDVAALAAIDDRAASFTGEHRPVFAIARVQRDIGAGSRLGFAFTDREDGDVSNRVASIDSRIVFGGVYSTQFQLAASHTRIGDETSTAPLWLARFTRSGRRFGMRYRINGIHEDFRSHSGFISRPGIVGANLSHSLTAYGSPGALVESLTGEIVLDGTWQYARFVDGLSAQDRKLHFNVNSRLRSGWTAGVSLLVETFGYDERLYQNYALEVPDAGGAGLDTIPFTGTPRLPNLDWVVQGSTPRWARFDGSVSLIWGRDENFFEWSSADILYATLAANWRPTDRVRIGGTYQHQQFDRRTDGSTVGIRRIPRLKVEYQVARPLFVRLVGEYDASRTDALRDDSRTDAPILIYDPGAGVYVRAGATADNRFRGDALLSYQPTPGTVFFVGYGSTSVEPDALRFNRLRRVSDGVFVKASYLFRL
jgi:hypothetical protein